MFYNNRLVITVYIITGNTYKNSREISSSLLGQPCWINVHTCHFIPSSFLRFDYWLTSCQSSHKMKTKPPGVLSAVILGRLIDRRRERGLPLTSCQSNKLSINNENKATWQAPVWQLVSAVIGRDLSGGFVYSCQVTRFRLRRRHFQGARWPGLCICNHSQNSLTTQFTRPTFNIIFMLVFAEYYLLNLSEKWTSKFS